MIKYNMNIFVVTHVLYAVQTVHVVPHQSYMDQCMTDVLCTAHVITCQSHVDMHNANTTKF